MGETGVGKTAVVVALAERLPIEVISLDSRQIYHGMRIGTAQPSAAERRLCRHHLIDFVSPRAQYSAAEYCRDFRAVYAEIRGRRQQPLVVGGAGFYLSALQEGLLEIAPAQTARLAEIRAQLEELSNAEVRRRLAVADPESWRRIHPHDRYRSQRALEITLLTGRTMTQCLRRHVPQPVLGLRFPVIQITRPGPELVRRIARRTAAMLSAGWIEETEMLMHEHGPSAPGLRSIGYQQIVAHMQGRLERADLPARIDLATRQYAKRQRTWFRGVATVGTVPPDAASVLALLKRCSQGQFPAP
jgi:tRNA dimethylallyltransferase